MCRGIWVPLSVSIETHAIQLQPHTCGVRPATNSNAGPCRHLVGGLPCQRQRQRRPACLPPLQRRTGPKKSTRPADLLWLGSWLCVGRVRASPSRARERTDGRLCSIALCCAPPPPPRQPLPPISAAHACSVLFRRRGPAASLTRQSSALMALQVYGT